MCPTAGITVRLTACDPLVQDPCGASRRRPVFLADDDESRAVDAVEIRDVVEIAVAGGREVADHLGRVDRLVPEARGHRAGEVEGPLDAHQLAELFLGLDGLLALPGLRDRLADLPHRLE